ncbi:MAG: glucose PTS transporter subunit EIIB, partial [Fusobacteriaceae bacterium]
GMAVVAFLDIKVIAVSGGLEFLAMMLPALGKTDTLKFILVGLAQIVVYYYTFRFLIQKLDLKTPGREKDKSAQDIKLYSKADYKAKEEKAPSHKESKDEIAKLVIEGLGGRENIVEVGNCFSRLRITLRDNRLIDKEILSQTKNGGIVKVENGVQIIFGLHVQKVRASIDKELGIVAE